MAGVSRALQVHFLRPAKRAGVAGSRARAGGVGRGSFWWSRVNGHGRERWNVWAKKKPPVGGSFRWVCYLFTMVGVV